MKTLSILRDLLALILISFLTYFLFVHTGKDILRLGYRQIQFFIELTSIIVVGIYMYSMHKKNPTILTVMLVALSIFAFTILIGISGNILNIVFLVLVLLLTITINLFKYNSDKEIEENNKN